MILEGGNFREMVGVANFKPITVYLLNDALVMASKKKTRLVSSATKKWTLDRFWTLGNITVTDLPDSKSTPSEELSYLTCGRHDQRHQGAQRQSVCHSPRGHPLGQASLDPTNPKVATSSNRRRRKSPRIAPHIAPRITPQVSPARGPPGPLSPILTAGDYDARASQPDL